jgi:hypothetical protein
VLAALTRSPRKELMMMSPHGYLGIEGAVVQRISDWIGAAGGR